MVKFINKWTGSEMWVSEDRVDEYKAAGHKPVAKPAAEKPQTVTKVTRKRTKK